MNGSPAALSGVQRNLMIALGLLLVVGIFLRGAPTPEIPYDLDSPGSQGLLALRFWLAEMGYRVMPSTTPPQFSPAQAANGGSALFLFPGLRTLTDAEAEAVHEWVDAGGTLALIWPPGVDAWQGLDFAVYPAADLVAFTHLRQMQPILPDRALRRAAPGRTFGLDVSLSPHALPLVAAFTLTGESERITVALETQGAGQVWHLDVLHDFSNDRLRDPDHAALLLALLRAIQPGGSVYILTTHLQPPESEVTAISSLRDWVYGTRWGLALLFASGLTLLYLAMQGIRLGPPLHEATLARNREAAEYVAAMAGLYQRGNRREAVAQRLARRLKLTLARRVGLSPDEPETAFIAALRSPPTELDAAWASQLADLFVRLQQPLNDEQLLQAADKVAAAEASNGRSQPTHLSAG